MRDDFERAVSGIFLKVFVDCSLRYFLANSKPMLEPEHMNSLRPLVLQAFTCRVMLRLQQDEDGIKGWETKHKDQVDLNKTLVTAVRGSFSTGQL